MREFYEKYGKYLIPILTFIGGIMLGFYVGVLRYESTVEVIKEKIIDIKDDLHHIENIIQNQVLTRVVEE